MSGMTLKEKRDMVQAFCDQRLGRCGVCPAESDKDSFCEKFVSVEQASEESLDDFIKKYITPEEDTEEEPNVENDVIKHPNHYCREGAMECIEEMIMLFGTEVVKHFCLCNIWKYRYRSGAKNGEEDIKKSDQYVRIYKGLISNE